MDFKSRFKDKISIVTKKGLKYTLFTRQQHNPVHQSDPSCPESPLRPNSVESSPIAKPKFDKLSSQKLSQSFQRWKTKTEANYFSLTNKKQHQFYVDQMIDKHRHLLQTLERRTTYKTINH